jgi:hypothetical protein
MKELLSNKAIVKPWISYPVVVFALDLSAQLKGAWLRNTTALQNLNDSLLSFLAVVNSSLYAQQ